jgi:type III restriction enzyme
LFTGFTKACHSIYKFDATGEKFFAQLIEGTSEHDIVKWLRPAPRQFRIYWDHHTKNYEPDFVVETNDGIWMVEIKALSEINASDTREKMRAAIEYCRHASEYNSKNGGKRWHYLLIPDEEIRLNISFEFLAKKFEMIN